MITILLFCSINAASGENGSVTFLQLIEFLDYNRMRYMVLICPKVVDRFIAIFEFHSI
jgi:hypothetical protein